MTDWIPIAQGFIHADVIRWEEAVYSRPNRRGGRARSIGTRRVTAEVIEGADADGWVLLLVRQCEILSETAIGHVVEEYKNGKELRRSSATIIKGKPQRLLWSDETARDLVASEFSVEPQSQKPRGKSMGQKRRTPRSRKPRSRTRR